MACWPTHECKTFAPTKHDGPGDCSCGTNRSYLTWMGRRIFIKLLPEFLLWSEFWQEHICPVELHARACGLMLSHVWLFCQPSDLKFAIDCNLVPSTLNWTQWVTFVEDITQIINMKLWILSINATNTASLASPGSTKSTDSLRNSD